MATKVKPSIAKSRLEDEIESIVKDSSIALASMLVEMKSSLENKDN